MLLSDINKYIRKPEDESTYKSLIKKLHDDSISNCRKVAREPLFVDSMSNQQLWQQVNRHLDTLLPFWNGYVTKAGKTIAFEAQQEQPQKQELEENQLEGEDEGMDIEEGEPVEEEQMQGQQQQGMEAEGEDGQELEDEQMMEDNEQEMDTEERLLEEKMLELEGEQDVGLYGDILDEDDEGDDQEANPLDAQDDELDMPQPKRKAIKGRREEEDNEQDDNLQDENFEHFREVEMENQQADQEEQAKAQQQEQGQDQITRLENKLLTRKGWEYKGEVGSKDRPLNSLVETELQFKRGVKLDQQITEQYNSQIEELIKRRVLDQLFDDRVRFELAPGFKEHFTALPEVSTEKNKQSLGELYEEDFKNSMGLKQTKEQRQKEEIMNLFKQLSYKLDCLSNFNFTPKPVLKEAKITQDPFLLKEEKIPINIARPGLADVEKHKAELRSDKELTHEDRQAKRLKNKRIARQRRKEKEAKKMNRSIEYGGQTKFEAEARKKIQRNKAIAKKVKYSQSGEFFKQLASNTSSKANSKPNPNINKLKA